MVSRSSHKKFDESVTADVPKGNSELLEKEDKDG